MVMKAKSLALLLYLLSLSCSKIDVNPFQGTEGRADSKLVSYQNKMGLVLGDIPWTSEVLLEDGTVIQPVTNILPGYEHDSSFYKLNSGTVVSMSFDVYPDCGKNGCTPIDLYPQALVILKGFSRMDRSSFSPKKDPIDPVDFKSILTRNDYFAAMTQCSTDTSFFGAQIIFAGEEFQMRLFLPDNRMVSSGTFSVTEQGTIKFTQTYLNPTLPNINANRLLNGEYHFYHYSIDNLSEDGSTHVVAHHPTDNIVLWKFDGNVFTAYKLEAPIKW